MKRCRIRDAVGIYRSVSFFVVAFVLYDTLSFSRVGNSSVSQGERERERERERGGGGSERGVMANAGETEQQ